MALKDLTKKERKIIAECLVASAAGPFFDDDEFHILFGLSKNQMLAIVERLPNIDDSDELTIIAINNSLNNLLGFPHRNKKVWAKYISVKSNELSRIYNKWRSG